MIDTAEGIRRFNEAFTERKPDLLANLVAESCAMEGAHPAPAGALAAAIPSESQ